MGCQGTLVSGEAGALLTVVESESYKPLSETARQKHASPSLPLGGGGASSDTMGYQNGVPPASSTKVEGNTCREGGDTPSYPEVAMARWPTLAEVVAESEQSGNAGRGAGRRGRR